MNLQNIKDLNFKHFSSQVSKKKLHTGNIQVMTSYISIITYRIKETEKGAKVTVVVDKNYHAKYQYTMYFDVNGE